MLQAKDIVINNKGRTDSILLDPLLYYSPVEELTPIITETFVVGLGVVSAAVLTLYVFLVGYEIADEEEDDECAHSDSDFEVRQ